MDELWKVMEKEELYICAHDTLLANVGLWDAFVIEKARESIGLEMRQTPLLTSIRFSASTAS